MSSPSFDHESTTPPTFGRRSLLLGGAAALAATGLLSACGGDDETTAPPRHAAAFSLIPLFPRDIPFVGAGEAARLPLSIADQEGILLSSVDLAEPLVVDLAFEGTTVATGIEVPVHSNGVPRPYFPLTYTFEHEGVFDIIAHHQGTEIRSHVQAYDPSSIAIPRVGQPLPPTGVPTTTEHLDVMPICTRNPQCEFHEHDFESVLGSGTAVAVLLASPRYCATNVCGPILEMLIETTAGRDNLAVLHTEVYQNPTEVEDLFDARLVPLATDYSLVYEPVLFVADGDGVLQARGDIVLDIDEMNAMLDLVS